MFEFENLVEAIWKTNMCAWCFAIIFGIKADLLLLKINNRVAKTCSWNNNFIFIKFIFGLNKKYFLLTFQQ